MKQRLKTQDPIDLKPILAEQQEEETPKTKRTTLFFSSGKRIFGICLTFRLVNCFLVQTYFNPDEHWQSLEVAHRIVFGYGHLTWEWQRGIRSYLHPLIFASLYKIMAFFQLDTPWFMMKAPRLLQSIFSSFGDFYLHKLSCLIFNEHVAKWVLFCQLMNWFMFFCSPRTLSNVLETVLTVISLYYWPTFRGSSKKVPTDSRKLALALAGLACAIRPTSAITWLYVGLLELFEAHDRMMFLFFEVLPIGTLVIMVTGLVDWIMYGSLVFVPLNFLKFNFLSTGGDYYGTHKWHWYFTEGFPVMIFSFLPFSAFGIHKSKQWKLFGLIVWVLGLYSILGHKEFRFVLPVLPIALMFAGYTLAEIDLSNKRKRSLNFSVRRPSKMQLAIFFLFATNLPMALYMSLVHQRGSEDVMNFLANEAVGGEVRSILFLTPCHATPYYSSLHHDLPMWFLDCSPSNEKGTLDESDRFMMDPVGFILNMKANWSFPSHIVLFDPQERQLQEFLTSHSYKELKRFFHAHFKVDKELQASIVVYALTA
ncbi:mannosyltransferase APTG1 isoform X2 [Aristolochia californica]|uniref:mannosyltransferase APTG1 isoform X2 n=1 Tax=Aristolochia californica TaxID=171875 RepID=UPI0035DFA893